MIYDKKKGDFYITCFYKNLGSNYHFTKVSGTVFKVDDENGAVWRFGIAKVDNHYKVTDIASGMAVTSWHDKKKDCLAEFERREKVIIDKLNEAMNSDEHYRFYVLRLEEKYKEDKNVNWSNQFFYSFLNWHKIIFWSQFYILKFNCYRRDR